MGERLKVGTHYRGHAEGTRSGTNTFVCTHTEDASCRDRTQVGAHGADIGSSLCCSGISLQEQCTRYDVENWRSFHFFLAHEIKPT